MTSIQQLGQYVDHSKPLDVNERKQATQFILHAVSAIMVATPYLQIMAWDPDSKECKEAIMEIAGRADFIIQLAKFLYPNG